MLIGPSMKSIKRSSARAGLAALLAACLAACAPNSVLYLLDSGYSLDAVGESEFAFGVHVNQLKQLGGEVNSAQFRLFVAERLKWHEMCPTGWSFLPCVKDGSCVQRTNNSVTVPGRCAAQ
jgi:hypothetical protein